jgi:preprotein translocase subunit SecD
MPRLLALAFLLICAGCGGAHHSDGKWFRIYGEGQIGPALDAGDVAARTARADIDSATGQHIVYFGLTRDGVHKFSRLTRALAQRGTRAGRPFHVLITVDGRVKSRPYIDYRVNPNGIPGDSGIQIDLPSRSECETLARRLRGD